MNNCRLGIKSVSVQNDQHTILTLDQYTTLNTARSQDSF
jgi:hypothetical protein